MSWWDIFWHVADALSTLLVMFALYMRFKNQVSHLTRRGKKVDYNNYLQATRSSRETTKLFFSPLSETIYRSLVNEFIYPNRPIDWLGTVIALGFGYLVYPSESWNRASNAVQNFTFSDDFVVNLSNLYSVIKTIFFITHFGAGAKLILRPMYERYTGRFEYNLLAKKICAAFGLTAQEVQEGELEIGGGLSLRYARNVSGKTAPAETTEEKGLARTEDFVAKRRLKDEIVFCKNEPGSVSRFANAEAANNVAWSLAYFCRRMDQEPRWTIELFETERSKETSEKLPLSPSI